MVPRFAAYKREIQQLTLYDWWRNLVSWFWKFHWERRSRSFCSKVWQYKIDVDVLRYQPLLKKNFICRWRKKILLGTWWYFMSVQVYRWFLYGSFHELSYQFTFFHNTCAWCSISFHDKGCDELGYPSWFLMLDLRDLNRTVHSGRKQSWNWR